MTAPTRPATVVVVAYRTRSLDLSWVPSNAPVIVVHNDDALAEAAVDHRNVRHLRSAGNVGFGAAVNAALPLVDTERVVLSNPDVVARAEHWQALSCAPNDEVVAVPLLDGSGRLTSVVNAYPTPSSTLLTAYRVGRVFPRGSRVRELLARGLGAWGHSHVGLASASGVVLPLSSHWASGALLSVATQRLRDVNGFDPAYFLYMEDVDLCRRLAARHPGMVVRIADVASAQHAVGGSATAASQRITVDRHYLTSIRRYAAGQRGVAWRALDMALAPRALELALRARRGA
jgi:N-acetylglucosaminyl-diphospho-decaprenol L-rhamnosyltransferase